MSAKRNPQGFIYVITLACLALSAILFLGGCSSNPEPWEKDYEPNTPAALDYRIKAYEDVIDDDLCVFPDGLYIQAPKWVCEEYGTKGDFALGTYSMAKAGYQHARNMAYLYAVREITRKTSEEIRSLSKAYGSSSGASRDEDIIQGISFKIAKNVQVVKSIVSPNQDVYLLVRAADVEDALEGSRERQLWKQYQAEKAHKELDSKHKEAVMGYSE